MIGGEYASLDILQKADPQQLAKIHSQRTSANHCAGALAPESHSQAAGLLVSLPAELRSDVALRMANLDQISPEIVNKIATVIGEKLQVDRRVQPRILWRRPRRRGDVQSAGFRHQQGNSRRDRDAESRIWSRRSAT